MYKRFMSVEKGVLYMLFSSLLSTFVTLAVKILSQHLPTIEIIFFRNIFPVFIIIIMLYYKPPSNKGGKPLLLLFRGCIGFAGILAFYYNIAYISLANAVVLLKTATFFTAFFAYIFLRESLDKKGWLAIFIGFIGIIFVTGGGLSLTKYDLLGIFSGVASALAYTSIRTLKVYYDVRIIVLSFALVSTIVPIILMLFAPLVENRFLDTLFVSFIMPKKWMWIYIILIGILTTFAQIYLTKAYSANSNAGIIATVSYISVPLSIILGVIFGDSFPSMLALIGMISIISSGVLVAKKKRKN